MNAKATKKAEPVRKSVVSTDIFGTTLTLNFITGQELSVTLDNLSPEIIKQAALHGLKQKLVDAAAIARNTDNGDSATPTDKYNAVKTVYDRITREDGTWNAIREGEVKHQGGIFVRAVMELTGKSKADIDAAMEGYSKEQIAALKKNPRVMDIMQRMQREEAAAAGNTGDDLLAQLAAPASDDGDDNADDETPAE